MRLLRELRAGNEPKADVIIVKRFPADHSNLIGRWGG